MGTPHSKATWQDAVRLLHQINPILYNTGALSRIFNKNQGQIWWTLHPEWRREFDKDRYHNQPGRKQACHASANRTHARKRKGEPPTKGTATNGCPGKAPANDGAPLTVHV